MPSIAYLSATADNLFIGIVAVFIVGVIVLQKFVLVEQFINFKKNHPVINYSIKRIVSAIVTIIIVVSIVFLLLRLLPKSNLLEADVLSKLKSQTAKQAYANSVYHSYGLDLPIYQQLFNYLKTLLPYIKDVCTETTTVIIEGDFYDAITGIKQEMGALYCREKITTIIDLGISRRYRIDVSVASIVSEGVPYSVLLMLPVMGFELVTGYILGILMAKNKTKLVDNIGLMYVYLAEAIPYIVYLYIMAIFFSKILHMEYEFSSDNIMTIIPSWITLWFISMATDAGYARRYTVDEMNADYVKFARSKGLSENRIFFTHIMRNTSVMLFRGIPIAVASALMGAYFLESSFGIPGIGQLLIVSIQRQDIGIVQALTLIFSLLTIVSYLISDLLAIALDPRTSLIKNS